MGQSDMYNFSSSVAPFTPWVPDIRTNPLGDGLIGTLWIVHDPDSPVRKSFMSYDTCHLSNGPFLGSKHRFVFRALPLYISLISLSFFHFTPRTHCQSAFVILVRDHSVQLLYSSLTPFLCSLTNLVSTLFFTSLFYLQLYSFYFPRLYTPVTPSRPVRVLSFVITYRQCLVRQVTS